MLCSPTRILDKNVYSPWTEGRLPGLLQDNETLVLTGGETDVCILATALGGIDYGYRIVLVADAICSSSDATHDALMELRLTRFSEQVEVVTLPEIIDVWR